ncbi:uncharacterized protein LOC113315280 [Papaver somniferum]|uniref:uncharacterized protein LOC113315280 n=1 Tax=Papaver somniferum TaxID=3469 RepID=UPI000E70500E|nr:uncharacterized protein LOC113315280 [Papaver somniferum]
MVLLVYVDDIILVGVSQSQNFNFIQVLKVEFAMKDLEHLNYFLGIDADWNADTHTLLLTQKKYSLELPKKHDMLECNPCKTPVATGKRASLYDGSLLTEAAGYRSDLSFAAGSGIEFTTCDCSTLYAHSDSGCPDTRKSTAGYGVFMGPNLVAWSSKKQPTISRSSTEAEYIALEVTATKVQWFLIS